MMMTEDVPRSVRRAALIGDRRAILVNRTGRNFTIKDARDLLLKYSDYNSDPDGTRHFFTARSWLIHLVWRKYFADHVYLQPWVWQGRDDFLHHQPKHVGKDATSILLGAEQDLPPLKHFVDACIEALITRGLLKPEPRRDTDGDLIYWMTDDGVLLSTAAWLPRLTKQKAGALIQGVLDRAVVIAQNPDDYLVEVALIGVFGSYTDEQVTTYNDLDVLYEYRRVGLPDNSDKSHDEWRNRAEQLWERDDRNPVTGRWGEEYEWPHKKLRQFLGSRKPQLRLMTAVSMPIRLKVLYRYPEGILKKPFLIDLPNGNHGPAWDVLMKNLR